MYHAIGEPEPLRNFLEAVYSPLFELPEPLYSWFDRYMDLWDR